MGCRRQKKSCFENVHLTTTAENQQIVYAKKGQNEAVAVINQPYEDTGVQLYDHFKKVLRLSPFQLNDVLDLVRAFTSAPIVELFQSHLIWVLQYNIVHQSWHFLGVPLLADLTVNVDFVIPYSN